MTNDVDIPKITKVYLETNRFHVLFQAFYMSHLRLAHAGLRWWTPELGWLIFRTQPRIEWFQPCSTLFFGDDPSRYHPFKFVHTILCLDHHSQWAKATRAIGLALFRAKKTKQLRAPWTWNRFNIKTYKGNIIKISHNGFGVFSTKREKYHIWWRYGVDPQDVQSWK